MGTLSPLLPLHRLIVVVDIEESTMRTNPARAYLRQMMYDLVEQSLRDTGITDVHHDPLIDRGDGVLVLIHPVDQAPKPVVLNTFVPALTQYLATHNQRLPHHRFRLRVALHAGEVHYDRRGPFGEAVDITRRLVDAPELKAALKRTTAPLALVTSDDFHRTVIRHAYDGIDNRTFIPLVRLDIGGHTQRGWVYNFPAAVPIAAGRQGGHAGSAGRTPGIRPPRNASTNSR